MPLSRIGTTLITGGKVTTGAGTLLIDATTDRHTDLPCKRHATNGLAVRTAHGHAIGADGGGEFCRHTTVGVFIGFRPIERDTIRGATSAAGLAVLTHDVQGPIKTALDYGDENGSSSEQAILVSPSEGQVNALLPE